MKRNGRLEMKFLFSTLSFKSNLYGPRITPQMAEWKGKGIQYNTEEISQKT